MWLSATTPIDTMGAYPLVLILVVVDVALCHGIDGTNVHF